MRNDTFETAERRETWQQLCQRTKGLCQTSFDHAMKYEPHSGAPGLDMDAIHRNPRFQKLRRAA